MYSPKISEDIIPLIYKKAKTEKKPMTQVVNDILREKLTENESESEENTYPKSKD
jgi:hypothetical protein